MGASRKRGVRPSPGGWKLRRADPDFRSGSERGSRSDCFDPQGNAFFTFNYVPTTDHVLGWSVRTTTGVVGAVQDFDPTVSADSAARLGFAASGEGIAAWDGVDFGFGYHLGALIRPAGAAFGLGIAIQSDMNPLTTPDLAVGTDGRAVIADIEAGEIHLLLRPAGGNVGTFVSGDIPVFTFGVPETPQVGLLSDGTALIAWKRSMALEWKTYSTGLVLGQTMGVLGAAPEIDLDLAVDAKDNGVLIWIQNNLVHASARPPGGTFDAARQIATTPIASHPRLARDGQGTTLVVWDAQHAGTSGTTYAIEAAAYGEPPEPPPPPPPCGTIRCVISAAIQGANCGDEHLSKALTKKLDGAIAKSEAAANAPAKKARRMSKAAKALFRRAGQLAKRAGRGRKPELSAECVTDLRSAVTTAIGLLT
jgi:hypothetical protein